MKVLIRFVEIFKKRIPDILIAGFIIGLTVYSFSPNFGAKWSTIDDHEIFHFIGEAQRLSPSRFMQALRETEVFRYGEELRYRPSYYVLRLLECMVWGKNPALWYGFRILAFAACLTAAYLTFRRYFSYFVAAFLTFSIFRFVFWHDVMIRLGPAEFYGAVGLTAFLVSFDRLLSNKTRIMPLILFLAGGLICFGVKENLAVLYLFTLWLLIEKKRTKDLGFPLLLAAGLQGALCLLVVSSIYFATRQAGVDIYANDVSLENRMALFDQLGTRTLFVPSLIITLLIGGIYLARKDISVAGEKIGSRPFVFSLICLVFFCANFIFYNGEWPAKMRYDFPALLIPGGLFAVLYYDFPALALRLNLNLTRRAFSVLFIVLLIYFNRELFSWVKHYYLHSADNANNTSVVTANLQRMAEAARKAPRRPIVITSSYSPDEYEYIISHLRFFRGMSVKNPISIEFLPAGPPGNALAKRLDAELIEISQNGNKDFAPLRKEYKNCFSIVLGGKSNFNCTPLEIR